MNRIKKGIAVLLCAAMCIPSVPGPAGSVRASDRMMPGLADGLPGSADGDVSGERLAVADESFSALADRIVQNAGGEVRYNTGKYEYRLADEDVMNALAEAFLQKYGASAGDIEGYEDDEEAVAAAGQLQHFVLAESEKIQIPVEKNAFFPYEVQFTYDGQVQSRWFMSKDDTVQVGEYEFSLLVQEADADALTQISLNVGGDIVDVYPQEKEFTNEEGGQAEGASLLPLKEVKLTAQLKEYTPVELSKVSFEKILTGDGVQLAQDASIMWRKISYRDDDYHIASLKDTIDLSFVDGSGTFEMIAGKRDQLAADNIRYLVTIDAGSYSDWLVPTVCTDDGGRKTVDAECSMETSYYNNVEHHYLEIGILDEDEKGNYFLSLSLNPERYIKESDFSIRVFEGEWKEEELKDATDITAKIWNADMSAVGSGYQLDESMIVGNQGSGVPGQGNITMVSYSGDQVTGCITLLLGVYIIHSYIDISYGLYEAAGSGESLYFQMAGYETGSSFIQEGDVTVREYTYGLYDGNPADGEYLVRFNCKKNSGADDSTRSDLYAYVGKYDSVAKAQAGGAVNIKDKLFGDGYPYSENIMFSIFLGNDGDTNQQKYFYRVKVQESSGGGNSGGQPALNDSTGVHFYDILSGTEDSLTDINAYFSDFDSYGDNNFYTIFVNREDASGTPIDLSHLALEFTKDKGVILYQGKGATETRVESEKTFIDFSKGMVQFTAVSENKENSENYYIRVLQAKGAQESSADDGEPQLYINSLEHESAKTEKDADGVLCSVREIMLDSHHDNRHDILVVNAGVTTMSALTAVLDSDYLEMDEYWDLKNKDSELAGFTTATRVPGLQYAALPNLAKLRLRAKSDDIEPNDYDDLGTITFTLGTKTVLKLKLTGTIGDPHITTENADLKAPVKYVPYGTVIENSNKYTYKNRVYYTHTGQLPKGMFLAASGELYGVPMETGTFMFTVTLHNSYGGLRDTSKTFSLTVQENTDTNVEGAQDAGYELKIKITGIYDTDSDGNYRIESEGTFNEFFDLYIDGEKLTKDTDYWASEGSTRITIAAQALKKTEGTHTIGVEFHKDRKDRHIRAGAQNYKVSSSGSSGGSSGGSGGSSGGSWGGGSYGRPSGGTTVVPSNPGGSQPDTVPSVPDDTNQPVTPVTPPQPETPEPTVSKVMQNAKNYTVKDGDTLMSIAKKYYGRASLWKRIYDANKDKIPASKKPGKGTKLVIPALSYTVKKGDTLKSIAKKYFGGQSKWKQIYDANRDVIPASKELKPGDRLVIPVPVCRMIYKTQKGDTLESIAKEYYGDSDRWKLIYEANKNKVSGLGAKKVKAGKMLLIPAMAYTVKKGDTTKSIAKKYYGAQGKWKIIYDANKDVIPTSQKLKTADKLVLPVPLCRNVYTAQKGDTLKSISQKFYGKNSKWKKIYDANTNKIPASKNVKAGRKLIIPAVNYTAVKGDDIKSIAKKYYGARSDWSKIYQVNRDVIPASKKITAGMKLVIPVPADI